MYVLHNMHGPTWFQRPDLAQAEALAASLSSGTAGPYTVHDAKGPLVTYQSENMYATNTPGVAVWRKE